MKHENLIAELVGFLLKFRVSKKSHEEAKFRGFLLDLNLNIWCIIDSEL